MRRALRPVEDGESAGLEQAACSAKHGNGPRERDRDSYWIEGKMHTLIENNRTEILALADRHGVRNVRVFGSMARDDADDTSDIDLLVSLRPGKTGLALGGLLMDVQDLLQRRVEVVTEDGLHPALRDRVLREARPL